MKTGWLLVVVLAGVARAQEVEVAELSIADAAKAMAEGRVTSKALVEAYLRRIAAFDQKGPKLNALITINPNALREAEALDRERAAKGPRGPLHGIPVIVKDNYGTTDIQTTAVCPCAGCVPGEEAARGRRGDSGEIQSARVGFGDHDGGIGIWADAESVRSGEGSGGIERRYGSCSGREFRGCRDGV